MKRKDFIRKTCKLGLCGSFMLFSGKPAGADIKRFGIQSQEKDAHQKFFENWITRLMENLEENFSEDERIKLMEECGRDCARSGAVQALKKASGGDFNKAISTLKTWLGEENVNKDGNTVKLVYTKCYCHLLEKGPDKMPHTYCYCSVGWIKEMFESVTGKPVEVKIHETVKRGGKQCRFTVKV